MYDESRNTRVLINIVMLNEIMCLHHNNFKNICIQKKCKNVMYVMYIKMMLLYKIGEQSIFGKLFNTQFIEKHHVIQKCSVR